MWPPVATALAPAALAVVASSAPSFVPVGSSGAAAGASVTTAAAAVGPLSHPVGDSRGLLCPPLPCTVLWWAPCRRRACCSAAVHNPNHIDLIYDFFRHLGVGSLHWVDRVCPPEL